MLLIVVAYLLLCLGLVVPVASVTQLFLNESSYSVLGGLTNLIDQGSWGMAFLVFGFSVAFPLGKLTVLLFLYFRPGLLEDADKTLKLLELLGKWSMFDVFVIAVTFSAANLEILNDIEIRWGVYLYGLSIVLSMCATMYISWSMNRPPTSLEQDQTSPALSRSIHGLSALFFIAGISLPLAAVEKWFFWQQEFSLITAMPAMVSDGEYAMPIILLVLVVSLPLLRFIALGLCNWQSNVSGRVVLYAQFVDKWAMFDVYLLAMLITLIKLGDNAEVQLLTGSWCLLVAAILGWIESYRFRQTLRY